MHRFQGILKGLEKVSEKFAFDVIYPIHPRPKKRLKEFKLEAKAIRIISPLDYLSFLYLENNAELVLTDSGGVQEEACILGIPCVTLRYNTERPETIEVGANVLAGADPDEIVKKTELMLNRKNKWENPYGDGQAGKKIIQILSKETSESTETACKL